MSGLNIYSTTVTTTGSAGSASGSASLVCGEGFIEWIDFDFNAAAPGATTDTTVSVAGGISPTILTLTNTATDARHYVRASASTSAGAAVTNSYPKIAVAGPLTFSVAQCDALAPALTVHVAVSR